MEKAVQQVVKSKKLTKLYRQFSSGDTSRLMKK